MGKIRRTKAKSKSSTLQEIVPNDVDNGGGDDDELVSFA